MNKLSIIIPAYNEKDTVLEIINKIKAVDLGKVMKELIIVDDFSKDGTREILQNIHDKEIKTHYHKKNMGKGMAIRTGLKHVTGNIVIIQDADLEYNPEDYKQLIKPILENKYDVVYGSRVLDKKELKYAYYTFYLGGRLVTFFTNLLYFSNLTDEPTCYKTFKTNVIKNIDIKGERFEWEPEVTAKILKKGIKIHEVPISYYPRDRKHGKKINWKDGIQAIWTLVKYRF